MNKKVIIIIGFFASCLVSVSQISTTNPANPAIERIELINADSLTGTTDTEAGLTRAYEGNVSFRQSDVSVHCKKAFHNISANTAEMIGNVLLTQQDMQLKSPKLFYNGEIGIAQSYESISISDSKMRLTANKGYYYTKSHIANFDGNVKISDDTTTINADSIVYNRRTRYSKAFGNVFVEDDSTIVYANNIEHQRDTRNTNAYGKVLVKGKYNGTLLSADTIINDMLNNYIVAKHKPILFTIDTIVKSADASDSVRLEESKPIYSFDTLSISSDKMESIEIEAEQRYLFQGNAEVNKKDIQAKANEIIYYKDKGIIFLNGSSCVWFDSTQIISDTITIYTRDNKLDRIIAEGKAIASIRNDTVNTDKINQLISEKIIIGFVNDTISYIDALGEAKSLMFFVSEKGSDGAARTFADSIKIEFQSGKPSNFIGLGGIVGEALPDELVSANPKIYYLPNYYREELKPKKRKFPDFPNK